MYLNSRPIYRPTCRPRPPTKIHQQRFIALEITAKTKIFLYSRRNCLIGRCARKRGNNAKAKHTISSVILLTVCRTILMMLVQRICIRSINTLLIDISLFFSTPFCLILYRYGKEKFLFGHSWEFRGERREKTADNRLLMESPGLQ